MFESVIKVLIAPLYGTDQNVFLVNLLKAAWFSIPSFLSNEFILSV